MAFIGRLHPLLIHFPIALVITAAAAEVASIVFEDARWRAAAVANVRAGAVFALAAAVTGWRLASAHGTEMTPLLEWHRWLGTITTGATVAAASPHPERNVDRAYRRCTGLRCSARECSWPSRGILVDCLSGVRTSCARNGGKAWHEETMTEISIDGIS